MEKICCKCGEKKLREEFYDDVDASDGKNSLCKRCLLNIQKTRWENRKRQAVLLMGGKCQICGYSKNYAALHFHHVDPETKIEGWATLRQKAWKTVVEELSKCILLCANCHAEYHNPHCVYTGEPVEICKQLNTNTGFCLYCGDLVFGTKYCSTTCSGLHRRKVKRPPREELDFLIKENGYAAVGRMYGVRDNTIRKWAKLYGILGD